MRVRAVLDTPLSRWLWLVKWLLIVPHVLVLIGLWVAFLVLGVVAMVAIVVTGRYPRPIFEFNLLPKAIQYVEDGQARGKVVISFDHPVRNPPASANHGRSVCVTRVVSARPH